ncbi:MAG TPA: FAD-dependent oxidoreductase [Bacillota bacterium]|nr:FAD-dependent oxidoreductase [Bacillota bacterium]
MNNDVIIIGAGLSGLTAGALLTKRGLKVLLFDKAYNPGGSCGTFKRNGVIFDQGSSMLFGFGEKGFNPHRFVFDSLEEPISMIKHDLLYVVRFRDTPIPFHADLDRFVEELGTVFPTERENLRRFYADLSVLYQHVMMENKQFTTPDETDPRKALKSMLAHPLSYLKFLSYLNKNVKNVLKKYFRDPRLFQFFDKLTSTYCYTTTAESPAVLAAVMFVDNHLGGSYYPCGSTVFLTGKLEKVIEENGGALRMESEVAHILFSGQKAIGVELKDGTRHFAEDIIYSGTVWNLMGKLIEPSLLKPKEVDWVKKLEPTYPSIVLYTLVDHTVIPENTVPVEMLVGNPDRIDESEVTVYIPSIDDRTVCPEGTHVVLAIGPSLEKWDRSDAKDYKEKKHREQERLLSVLERRFPNIRSGLRYAEVATPLTIERYTNKNNGSVAGPKQKLGQHMFKRLHTRSRWNHLFFCGESTVMGTGTPAVTVSGLSAANAILKDRNREPYVYREGMKSYVQTLPHPFTKDQLFLDDPEPQKSVRLAAWKCDNCEHPTCSRGTELDVRGILRRVVVGNFTGAKRLCSVLPSEADQRDALLSACEKRCIRTVKYQDPVEIKKVLVFVAEHQHTLEEK